MSPWIRSVRNDARLRLLCLPHAGGGTQDYRTWQEHFPATIDVCPVVLAGRETRMSEPADTDLVALADRMVTDLRPLLREAPVALYGHSMGAWIAFEFARALRRQRMRAPVHVFIGARRAPNLPDTRPPLYQLPDPQLVDAIQERYAAIPQQLLDQPAILRMFLPTMRADFTLLDTYAHREEDPLDCPITAFRGSQDTVVQATGISAWRHHTAQGFQVRPIPGGHFFLRDSPDLLCDAILGGLRPHL